MLINFCKSEDEIKRKKQFKRIKIKHASFREDSLQKNQNNYENTETKPHSPKVLSVLSPFNANETTEFFKKPDHQKRRIV